MVEVFKTSVQQTHEADVLITLIQETFEGVAANFDLDDCDKILRIQCESSEIQPARLISLLKEKGFNAEVLPDNIPVIEHTVFSNSSEED